MSQRCKVQVLMAIVPVGRIALLAVAVGALAVPRAHGQFTKPVAVTSGNGYETAAMAADKDMADKLAELDVRLKAPSICDTVTTYQIEVATAVRMVGVAKGKWDIYYKELVDNSKALSDQLAAPDVGLEKLDDDFQKQQALVTQMQGRIVTLPSGTPELDKAREDYRKLVVMAQTQLSDLKQIREKARSAADAKRKLGDVRGIFAETWALVRSSVSIYYGLRQAEVRDRYGLPAQACLAGLGPRQ